MKRKSLSLVVGFLSLLSAGTPVTAAQRPQNYTSGSFAVYLEGSFVGYVSKMSGGFAEATVVEELPPDDYYIRKHVDYPPGFEQITLVIGPGMEAGFYQWITTTLNGNYLWKDGAIVAVSSTGKPIRTLEFYDAQITQVAFPRMDGAVKDPFFFTVKITPSQAFMSTGGVQPPATKAAVKWIGSNFRLAIDGLDMKRTSSIESIAIDVPLGYPPGTICVPPFCPPPRAINFPNLQVTLSLTGAESVVQWYEQFVYNAQDDERGGSIELLDASLRNTVLHLELNNLGPISVENVELANSAGMILKMYSEFIRFAVP